MNTKPLVKLVKKAEPKTPEVQTQARFFIDSNRWSTAVRSWVSEYQQDRRGESLPAFDSLFKDALPQ